MDNIDDHDTSNDTITITRTQALSVNDNLRVALEVDKDDPKIIWLVAVDKDGNRLPSGYIAAIVDKDVKDALMVVCRDLNPDIPVQRGHDDGIKLFPHDTYA